MSAGRAAARMKPVIVVKAGRHAEGARAAASHTGALAGTDAVYDTAFRRAGMLRVLRLEELFDAAQTLAVARDAGDRLAILTNGGGAGVLATDALIDPAAGSPISRRRPSPAGAGVARTWPSGNPVDIIGDAGAALCGGAGGSCRPKASMRFAFSTARLRSRRPKTRRRPWLRQCHAQAPPG